MPGTLVTDALEPQLLAGATLNAAGTTNGTAVQVDRPGEVSFKLQLAAVTGTTPTLDVTLQGSDVSNFGSGVVTYGQIETSGGSQANIARQINAHVYKKFLRAVVTLGGTSPVYTGAVLNVRLPHDRRTADVTA